MISPAHTRSFEKMRYTKGKFEPRKAEAFSLEQIFGFKLLDILAELVPDLKLHIGLFDLLLVLWSLHFPMVLLLECDHFMGRFSRG